LGLIFEKSHDVKIKPPETDAVKIQFSREETAV